MELSMATCYFYDSSPEEMLKHFAAVGCSFIELSTEHSEDLVNRQNTKKTALQFKSLAGNLGVGIPQGHLLISINLAADNQSEVVDTMKKWLEFYMELGIKQAVVHPGGRNLMNEGFDPHSINIRRASTLRHMTDFIKGTDMTICLENTHNTLAFADELCELIGMVGSDNLGICLDTGHLNISNGNQGEFIRKSGHYLKALHIHDNNGSSDQHVLPYSLGNIDWNDVSSSLKSIGFSNVVNYEIPLESRAPLEIRYAKFEYIKLLHNLMFNNKEC